MSEINYPLSTDVIVKTIVCINDRIQIELNSDSKTGKKLEDDDVLRAYLNALIEANVLKQYGIQNADNISSIQRLDFINKNKSKIALFIATSVQQGVEHVQCHVEEERICAEDNQSSEDSSSSGLQQVPNVPIALTLRWNSLMTKLLIQKRGDMDQDFRKAKYKFHLWERLAAKMNLSLSNVKVTAKDCDDKWRNIVATYRKNIEKMKTFGENSVRWIYFEAMDRILKGTDEFTDIISRNCRNDTLMLNNIVHSECEFINEPLELEKIECGEKTLLRESNMVGPIVDELLHASRSNQSFCIADITDYDSNDIVITRKRSGDRREWTTEECLTFMSLRRFFAEKFKTRPCTDEKLAWEELAHRMNTRFFSDFDRPELQSLWHHLTNIYDENLNRLKSQGVDTVKWKYFAVMDEICGGTKEIADICVPRPGDHLLNEFDRISSNCLHLVSDSQSSTHDALKHTISMNVSDNESDSGGSLVSYSGTLWTKNMVKLLISLHKSIASYIIARKLPVNKHWSLIARKLQVMKKVNISEKACEEKWRCLMQTYKKNLIARKNRGANVLWPHFWKMREIFGDTVLEEDSFELSSLEHDTCDIVSTSSSIAEHTVNSDHAIQFTTRRLNSLMTIVTELRHDHNRTTKQVFEYQQTKIDEIQNEQKQMKNLLLQVLHKLS